MSSNVIKISVFKSPESQSFLAHVGFCVSVEVSGKSVCPDAFPVRNRTKLVNT